MVVTSLKSVYIPVAVLERIMVFLYLPPFKFLSFVRYLNKINVNNSGVNRSSPQIATSDVYYVYSTVD